jgi:hypothetical protein
MSATHTLCTRTRSTLLRITGSVSVVTRCFLLLHTLAEESCFIFSTPQYLEGLCAPPTVCSPLAPQPRFYP